MHEIITLQLGQRSNYVATHFWNAQESYFTYAGEEESIVDHDVHFRAGLGVDGVETFTPRTLIYDLKGGFGSLRKFNALYEIDEGHDLLSGLWDGPSSVQHQSPLERPPYQIDLEQGLPRRPLTTGTVRYWSDFNRVFYHPKSIVQINEYELNSRIMPFEDWSAGEELFNSLNKEHDLLDRDFRSFAEECDLLQGVQMLTGVDDAWGGFAARYLDHIRDEFGKSSVWVWALEDGHSTSTRNQMRKGASSARSILNISSQASLYVPMVDPPATLPRHVQVDASSEWHTSALLSTAMETMTLPSHLKSWNSSRATMNTMEDMLRRNESRNIAVARLGVEDAMENGFHHDDTTTSGPHKARPGYFSLYPTDTSARDDGSSQVFSELEVRRQDAADIQSSVTIEARTSQAQSYVASLPVPLLDSFPTIYGSRSRESNRLAARASLSIESSVAGQISHMQRRIGRAVGLDEREMLLDGLGDIAEAYREGWSGDTDSGDDL